MVNSISPPPIPFPSLPPTPARSCTLSTCTNGHTFTPTLAIGKCPGCTSPVLALRLQLCPYCNEPVRSISIRATILSEGMALLPICSPTCKDRAESIEILLTPSTPALPPPTPTPTEANPNG